MGDIRQKILNNVILPIDEESIRFVYSKAAQKRTYHVMLRSRDGNYMQVCNSIMKYRNEVAPEKIIYHQLCKPCTFSRFRAIGDGKIKYDTSILLEFYNNIRAHKSPMNYSIAKNNEYEETGDLDKYLENSSVDERFYRRKRVSTGSQHAPAHSREVRFRDNILSGLKYCNHK